MIKLYLTLEDADGQKVERVVDAEMMQQLDDYWALVGDMFDTLKESKKPL